MLRKLGWLFTLGGAAAAGLLIYNWVNNQPISSNLFLGVLVLLLGLVLLRRPSEQNESIKPGDSAAKPSRMEKTHHSWISKDR